MSGPCSSLYPYEGLSGVFHCCALIAGHEGLHRCEDCDETWTEPDCCGGGCPGCPGGES